LLVRVSSPGAGIIATVLSAIGLFFGSSGIFLDLQQSFRVIWNVPGIRALGLWGSLQERLLSFMLVVITGILLMFSVLLSTTLTVISRTLPYEVIKNPHTTEMTVSFVVTISLFAIIYLAFSPEAMPWRHAFFGALITAVLFAAGKAAISLYIGTVAIGSPYGAASSLFAFLVWLYYSSQVFFIGAIITRVSSRVSRISNTTGAASADDSETLARRGPFRADWRPTRSP
jgi:membrane protein